MVVFKAKIWLMPKKKKKKATMMHAGGRQSGLPGQLCLTVVLETTNGAFINSESRGW